MHLGISYPDKIVRTIAVYFVLAILLRLVGRRDLAQLNAFDLVVMLLLSNIVQNAVIGPDNSLLGGVVGAVVLLLTNGVMAQVIRRSDRVARILEGTPTVLARDGKWDEKNLRDVGLRRADVEAAVRRQGATGIGDVSELTMEAGGTIVATLEEDRQPATVADIARLEAKLDALLAARS